MTIMSFIWPALIMLGQMSLFIIMMRLVSGSFDFDRLQKLILIMMCILFYINNLSIFI